MSDSDDGGWDVEFDVNLGKFKGNPIMYNIASVFKLAKIVSGVVFIIFIVIFLYMFFNPTKSGNYNSNSSGLISLNEVASEDYDKIYKEYYDKFFEIVKSNTFDYRLLDDIIKSGISIDTTDKDGKTALFYAAVSGNRAMVGHLLHRGADPFALDNEGLRAIDYIDKTKNSKIYIALYDAMIFRHELMEGRGVVNNIIHKLDKSGNIISTTVNGKPYQVTF